MRVATPVNLIISENEKILLVKRKEKEDQFEGCWSIPGGGPEIGETYEDAIKREINEEINCKITIMKYFKSYFFNVNNELSARALYFYGKVNGEIKLNEEHSEYKWFTFEELCNENIKLAFNQKEVIFEFIEFMKKKNYDDKL
jgi:mutator protein MutT